MILLSDASHAVHNPNLWDFVRFATSFVDLFIIIIAGYVVFRYFVAWRVTKLKSVAAALLPNHVWLIALSYVLFVVPGSFTDAYTRLGEGISARAIIYFIAAIIGFMALTRLVGYEGRKYRKQTNYIFRPDFDKEI